jgi:hypothetical protein
MEARVLQENTDGLVAMHAEPERKATDPLRLLMHLSRHDVGNESEGTMLLKSSMSSLFLLIIFPIGSCSVMFRGLVRVYRRRHSIRDLPLLFRLTCAKHGVSSVAKNPQEVTHAGGPGDGAASRRDWWSHR